VTPSTTPTPLLPWTCAGCGTVNPATAWQCGNLECGWGRPHVGEPPAPPRPIKWQHPDKPLTEPKAGG
jgi:hypothetical protein